jgi:hypothetical protein
MCAIRHNRLARLFEGAKPDQTDTGIPLLERKDDTGISIQERQLDARSGVPFTNSNTRNSILYRLFPEWQYRKWDSS